MSGYSVTISVGTGDFVGHTSIILTLPDIITYVGFGPASNGLSGTYGPWQIDVQNLTGADSQPLLKPSFPGDLKEDFSTTEREPNVTTATFQITQDQFNAAQSQVSFLQNTSQTDTILFQIKGC